MLILVRIISLSLNIIKILREKNKLKKNTKTIYDNKKYSFIWRWI